jgi:hypothetical protein
MGSPRKPSKVAWAKSMILSVTWTRKKIQFKFLSNFKFRW